MQRDKSHELSTKSNNEFLEYYRYKSGVYIISPAEPQRSGDYVLVKVGEANSRPTWDDRVNSTKKTSGLKGRIDQYLLYWPAGIRVWAVMTTSYKKSRTLEQDMHSYLASKERQATFFHNHREEWFWVSASNIRSIVKAYAKKHGASTMFLSTEEPGYVIHTTFEATAHKVIPYNDDLKERQDRNMDTPLSTVKVRRVKHVETDTSDAPRVLDFE